MAFRFVSLGSGSRGNATLIEAGGTRVLLDCGFPAREIAARCASLDFDPVSLDAILVTHEHGDHVRGVGAVARRYGLPVWMTHGTSRAASCRRVDGLQLFSAHADAFRIGELDVMPVPVAHDAREPIQYRFGFRGLHLGILTDVGSITRPVLDAFGALDALLLEFNHDIDMLAAGPYPPSLQARVGGRFGHLNNSQAVDFLHRIDRERLRCLVAGHLSERNNSPARVRQALHSDVPDICARLHLLEQDGPSPWFDVDA